MREHLWIRVMKKIQHIVAFSTLQTEYNNVCLAVVNHHNKHTQKSVEDS